MRDFISQLPNELLHKVLLNLTTRESVKTSVLSTRWKHLWQNVPGLIFNAYDRDVLDFLDRFLNLRKELSIERFTLRVEKGDIPLNLIDQVLTRRVQLLSIDLRFGMFRLPVSFYTCETLVNLHLVRVKLDDFDGSEFINLPCLQVMHLKYAWITSDVVLEMLISHSPVLQELLLDDMRVSRVKVRSQTLRRLSLARICKHEYKLEGYGGECRVLIDTPNLEFMNIIDEPLESLRVENVSSSIKICIDVQFMYGNDDFSNTQILHKFFARFSQVTDLSISGRTLRGIYRKVPVDQQLPELKNLICLYAYFTPDSSEMLSIYLSSCPNLKSIALDFRYSPNMEIIANSPVPKCLQTSIENVEIKMTPKAYEKSSRNAQIKLAKYILDNATALKKFTLYLDEKEDMCSSVLKQILTFQNRPSLEVKIRVATPNTCLGFTFNLPRFFSRSLSSSY